MYKDKQHYFDKWHRSGIKEPSDHVEGDTEHGWYNCMLWCEKEFGTEHSPPEGGYIPGSKGRWQYVDTGVWAFRRKKDYTWFLLRWA